MEQLFHILIFMKGEENRKITLPYKRRMFVRSTAFFWILWTAIILIPTAIFQFIIWYNRFDSDGNDHLPLCIYGTVVNFLLVMIGYLMLWCKKKYGTALPPVIPHRVDIYAL